MLVFMLTALPAFSQDEQIFQHPDFNFRIQASTDWVQILHPEDESIFEIADPESVLRVRMWQANTGESGADYLLSMAKAKDLVYDAEPALGKINDHNAWVLDATCCMKEKPVRVVLVAVPNEEETKSLYIAQFLCPESKLKEKEPRMEELIYSLQISD
jgi:hypothetical protein